MPYLIGRLDRASPLHLILMQSTLGNEDRARSEIDGFDAAKRAFEAR